jgi:hypothetical protein
LAEDRRAQQKLQKEQQKVVTLPLLQVTQAVNFETKTHVFSPAQPSIQVMKAMPLSPVEVASLQTNKIVKAVPVE